MPRRRFSDERCRLCDDWFAAVETNEAWTDQGPVGEGESRSIRVANAAGLIGIAKPGPAVAANTVCRAAHEKLAFDLAHILELPVPPVILWGENMPATYVRGRSISAWAFQQAMKWHEADAKNLLSAASKDSVRAQASAMRVFHTWISDTDRKSDHTQVDLSSPDGQLGIAFIDHAYSQSFVWKAPNHAVGACAAYMPVPELRDIMVATADRIAAVPDAEVTRLVHRIPVSYLPDPQRGHILSNLLARKGNLRTALGI